MSGDLVTLAAGGLQIVFSRAGDRYRHSLIAIGQASQPLLVSREGAGEEAWPASPPLQELHVERRGERKQVALLVGRAGRSHWSLSVELDAAEETIIFDAACRCSAPVEWLGSSYESPCFDAAFASRDEGAIIWPAGYELQIMEGEALWSEPDHLRVAASWNRALTRQTVRWRYRLGRQKDEG